MRKLVEGIRLKRDFRLRVLSIFFAVLLWIYVVSAQNPDVKKELVIPINIINTEALSRNGFALIEHQNFTANIKIKAKQDIITKVDKSDIEAVVDLTNYSNSEGKVNIPVTYNVIGEKNVQIIESKTKAITLEIQRIVQEQKTVEVDILNGQNDKGKYLVKSVKPNVVTISGPKNLVDNVQSVKVTVDAANSERDITVIKKYKIYDKNNNDITNNLELTRDNQNIQVELEYVQTKKVPVVPDISGEVMDGYYISQINAIPDMIDIYGNNDSVDGTNQITTKRINVSNINENITKELKLLMPSGIKTDFNGNVQINIVIKKGQTVTKYINGSDIKLENTTDKYLYKFLTKSIKLQLTSSDGVVSSDELNKLMAHVDVDGLKSGQYYLPISINASSKLKLVNQKSVLVKISRK